MQGYITLGKITTVYGVKGWVKVQSFTDPFDNILDYRDWRLKRQGSQAIEDVVVVDGRRHNKSIVVQLQGYDDRERARSLAQAEIQVLASTLPEPDEGEFYWHQLQGMTVIDVDDEQSVFGIVDSFLATGANDVMVVRAPTARTGDDQEILIPWLPERVIKHVDLEARVIEVDWQKPE